MESKTLHSHGHGSCNMNYGKQLTFIEEKQIKYKTGVYRVSKWKCILIVLQLKNAYLLSPFQNRKFWRMVYKMGGNILTVNCE